MATIAALRAQLEAHRMLGYDLIRMYLGIALFVRGWLFVADSSRIMVFVEDQNWTGFSPWRLSTM